MLTSDFPQPDRQDHLQGILALSSSSSESRIYILGQLARRVTFLSQQTRACNLLIALRELPFLDSRSHIRIVGAGLAGLTAAAMAHRLDIEVDLVEQAHKPLALQSGNFVRFIHPHLLDWPAERALHSETSLPVLNWKADLCDEVIRQIMAEWNAIYARNIHMDTLTRVTTINESGGRVDVTTQHCVTGKQDCKNYAAVILATGFGLEKGYRGVEFLSYWSNDKLNQESFERDDLNSYLVD